MSYSRKSFSIFQRDILLFISNTITGVVIARTLGPDLRGLFAIVLLIPSYAESFGRLKYDIAAIYFLGKQKVRLGEMIFILNSIAAVSSMLIIIIILLNFNNIYSYLFMNTEINMRFIAHLVLLIIPLQFIYINYSYMLIYLEDIEHYNKMVIFKALTGSITSIVLIVGFGLGIKGAVIGSIAGYIIPVFIGVKYISVSEKAVVSFKINLLWEMTKFSFQYYITGIISYLHQYGSNLMLIYFVAPIQVGFFSMAKNQSQLITKMIPAAVNTLLFPKISKSRDPNDSYMITIRSFRITLLILIASGLLLTLVIKPLVWILYGSDYLPMILPFIIILPGFVISQSSTIFNSYYSGIGRPDLVTKLSLLPLIAQILLSFMLMPRFGIIGGAIAFSSSNIILSIASMLVFKKLTGASAQDYIIKYTDISYVANFARNYVITIIRKR
jgi:O-antigen/teichoic acid export membrane protein